eukprot:TRINITY_DN30540_c0_g1_i7.p1 TRINITY_DN30540_c0_g1~~TRINITY_DN30540_c0_g1_i7.p1  ORF type:complete len:527 (+),score=48.97 TRINITY_DN30540_c0_g1_i7:63-1643(+)
MWGRPMRGACSGRRGCACSSAVRGLRIVQSRLSGRGDSGLPHRRRLGRVAEPARGPAARVRRKRLRRCRYVTDVNGPLLLLPLLPPHGVAVPPPAPAAARSPPLSPRAAGRRPSGPAAELAVQRKGEPAEAEFRCGDAVVHSRRGAGRVADVGPDGVVVEFASGSYCRYAGRALRDGRLRAAPAAAAEPCNRAEPRRALYTPVPEQRECTLREATERRAERQRRLAALEQRLERLVAAAGGAPLPAAGGPPWRAADKERARRTWCPAWPPAAALPPWWDPGSPAAPLTRPDPQGPPLHLQLDPEQSRALERVAAAARAELDAAAEEVNPDEVRRFLVARKWDEERATAGVVAAARWRRQRTAGCALCTTAPDQHHFFLVGWDRQRRPVMYSCFRYNKDRDSTTMLQHAVWMMERAAVAMPHDVGNWVHLVNFAGFGVADANPILAKDTAQVLQRYFPERLGCLLLIDQPWAFEVVLRAVRVVASQRTMSKVHSVRSADGSAAATFAELFEPPLAIYLDLLIERSKS